MSSRLLLRSLVIATLASLPAAGSVRADSVAQIATAVRISRATAAQIDPQGRPDIVSAGSDTAVRKGDVLTFVAAFTPVPNGGYRGLGGYVTVYIPRNTEVVGARIIDRDGNTIAPRRGGLAAEGVGPQGDPNVVGTNDGGSMSQLYADTGIFYATDPRTNRVPDGSLAGGSEVFLLVSNGIQVDPATTAFGQLDNILGAVNLYAHSEWDTIQAHAFGTGSSPYSQSGRGNTLFQYGSPVAGPETFYRYQPSYSGASVATFDYGQLAADGVVGPWHRIQTLGGEIGRIVAHDPPTAMQDPGEAMRVGVLAQTGGVPDGFALNGGTPLPSYAPGSPSDPYTRALRFAVGELIVGQEYFSEFSLRVLDTPLDPVAGADVVCAEVFGGDASSEGTKDGKDNAWRYFLPAPACVSLNLLYDLDVSQLVALPGDDLVYTITGKNLTTTTQNNVVVRYCYNHAEESFLSADAGYTQETSTDCPEATAQDSVYWTLPSLAPGDEFSYQLSFDAIKGGKGGSIVARAMYLSDELPLPGFQTVAFTVVDTLALLAFDLQVSPNVVPDASTNGTATYTARITNSGTGVAECGADCSVTVTLPDGFAYVNGSLTVNSAAAADGVQSGNDVVFSANLANIDVGGALSLSFDVDIPAGTSPGVYTSTLEAWLSKVGGQRVNDSVAGLATIVVNTAPTATPSVPSAPLGGDSQVCGTAAANSTVRVYLAGIAVASGTASQSGSYCVTVPSLLPGQAISVTSQAPGEVESQPSDEIIVAGFTSGAACGDGLDNDGDGLIDFPDDPGCASLSDVDEATLPECADGIDQDNDGKVDLEDEGCSSLLDPTEGGAPACSDGVDNDGDGRIDDADQGCDGPDDPSELDVAACSDGIDNDGDGLIDFPFDPGCAWAGDNDETEANSDGTVGDAGVTDGGNTDDAGTDTEDGGYTGDAGDEDGGGIDGTGDDGGENPQGRMDLGGVDAPFSGGCSTQGGRTHGNWLPLTSLLLALYFMRRRRAA